MLNAYSLEVSIISGTINTSIDDSDLTQAGQAFKIRTLKTTFINLFVRCAMRSTSKGCREGI